MKTTEKMLINFFMIKRRFGIIVTVLFIGFIFVSLMNLLNNQTTMHPGEYAELQENNNQAYNTKKSHSNAYHIKEDYSKYHGLPQKCKVPNLDPYHPDVKPFMKKMNARACDYPKLTEVTDNGYLQVRDTQTVTQAKYCYLQRVNDESQKYTDWIVFYDKNAPTNNKEVKLTEDFVKISISVGKETREEFHMYPVRKEQRGEAPLPPKADQLNIAFVMIDSTSHSSAERYLKKTLKKMKQSKSTVVLNGHNIVGDGTTAQICALFMGELENKLPEARRGYAKANYVDRWPFLWKDYKTSGYTTLYSEDSPQFNTFNYRLKGFNNSPTDHYLRNFWLGASPYIEKLNRENPKCSFQIMTRYLKQFMKNYHDKPTFSYMVSSDLAHNESPYVQLVDDDLVELLEFFEDSGLKENTLLVIFGDHGDRSSGYRATMTGKLEERLPFISFTLPSWFPEKYPDHFKNLQLNADLLTSYFDIYATLRHLKTFPEVKHKHRYGTSLFTDLSHLNRTCSEVGVLDHWCSCLDYEELKIDDPIVTKAAEAIVSAINQKNADIPKAKDECATLTLDKINRAGIIAPGSKVQKFSHTFKDKTCDECGVKEGKASYKVKNYEVVFTVLPSNAKYEATAVLDISKGTFTANEGISRINLYSEQPHCVQKEFPYLRPFCYCKKQL